MPKEIFDYKYELQQVSDEVYKLDCEVEDLCIYDIAPLVGRKLRIHLKPVPENKKFTSKDLVMVTSDDSEYAQFIIVPRSFLRQIEL